MSLILDPYVNLRTKRERDPSLPRTCGECVHCTPVTLQIPDFTAYATYRCGHPKGCDWKGEHTGVSLDSPPPPNPNGDPFCPLERGFGMEYLPIYQKLGMGNQSARERLQSKPLFPKALVPMQNFKK